MKKRMKASKNRRTTYILLALAAVLLLMSGVGSTRAALTYFSENYTAEITVNRIGVSLTENGNVVSHSNYGEDNNWDTVNGSLLTGMLDRENGEKLILNKQYPEALAVVNSGSIDTYVRVRLYKYWTRKGSQEKLTTLKPEYIKLNLITGGEWIVNPDTADGEKANEEYIELYHVGPLLSGQTTGNFADSIAIDDKVTIDNRVEQNGNVITTTYRYDDVEFHLEAEVDAVQTHNAQDAIMSAWGVDAQALGIL